METFKYSTDGETTETKVERTLPRKIIKYLEKVGQFPKRHAFDKDNFMFVERWIDNTKYNGAKLREIRADGKHR